MANKTRIIITVIIVAILMTNGQKEGKKTSSLDPTLADCEAGRTSEGYAGYACIGECKQLTPLTNSFYGTPIGTYSHVSHTTLSCSEVQNGYAIAGGASQSWGIIYDLVSSTNLCASGTKGCVDNLIKWTCFTGGGINYKSYDSCPSSYACNNGECISQCTTRLSSLSSAIVTWLSNPTSANKNNAINSALQWAEAC